MSGHLPPLNALKAFEAVGRHLSLKKAAEELNVTPAAISHQIQQLEAFLGVRLFRRRYRRIEMTEVTQLCMPKLQEGFECLRQAVERVRRPRGAEAVTVAAAPSFTARWLMPRLHRFVAQHPEIDVRVSTRMRQFSRQPGHRRGDVESALAWADEVDVVIIFGTGNYPSLAVDKVLAVSVTPLCSPALLKGGKALKRPADLARHELLHDDRGLFYEGVSFWDIWLKRAKVTGVDTSQGPHFTHSVLAMEAAMAGDGIVATTPQLARSDIAAGRLVAPFTLEVPLASSYYMLSHEETARREIVASFRAWLVEEAEENLQVSK